MDRIDSYNQKDEKKYKLDEIEDENYEYENDDGYTYEDDYEYRDEEMNKPELNSYHESNQKKKKKNDKDECETFIAPEKVSASDSGKSSGFVSTSNSNSTITPVTSNYELAATESVSTSVKSGKKSTKIQFQKVVHARGSQIV